MEKIAYPTMNALSYAMLCCANSGYDLRNYGNFGYTSTNIEVPMPTECPCCNKTMASNLIPIIAVNNLLLSGHMENNEDEPIKNGTDCNVVSIYRCTSCNSLFSIWSKHKAETNEHQEAEWFCDILNMYPFNAHKTLFSNEIISLSPEFASIYKQSELAEEQGLSEICGMGYRRALEFLVDAYIRKIKPNETIDLNLGLGNKINNYIDDLKIKTLAQKSTWLGNDATHIVNKHPDRNITDMKKFIKAMTTMIDADFAFDDANTIEKN